MATTYDKGKADLMSTGVIAREITLRPVLLSMIEGWQPLEGKHVYDVGCGDGRYSLEFALRGATVTATDVSEDMIMNARQQHPHRNIRYVLADASTFAPRRSDYAFMNLVVPDIDGPGTLDQALANVTRCLDAGGRFLLSVLHPSYPFSQDSYDSPLDFRPEQYHEIGHTYRARAKTPTGDITFKETHFTQEHVLRRLEKNGLDVISNIPSTTMPRLGIHLPKYLVIEAEKRRRGV